MAHFAKVENGIVTNVIVVDNRVIGDGDHTQSEAAGQAFVAGLGLTGEWVQTSYNANFRGKYAGIGDIYDAVNDIFTAPTTESEPE